MFWKDTLIDIIMEKNAYRVKLFHGTHLENLTSILRKGLINNIFLTPDIERAARYAFGPNLSKNPVILELIVTKPKRLKKMKWDPLDREEDISNTGDGNYSPFDESVEEIEDAITSYFQDYLNSPIVGRYEGLFMQARRDGLHVFEGINIYKELLFQTSRAFKNDYRFKQNRNYYLNVIKDFFPVGDYNEHIMITPTGTFRLKPEYFSTLKQIQYDERIIPASAIKALWVREEDFPEIQTEIVKNFGADLLPDEKQDHYFALKNPLENLNEDFFSIYGIFTNGFKESLESFFNDKEDFWDLEFAINQNIDPIKNILEHLKTSLFYDGDLDQKVEAFTSKWFDLNNIKNNINNPSLLEEFNSDVEDVQAEIETYLYNLEEQYSPFEQKIVKEGLWKRIDIDDFQQFDALMNKVRKTQLPTKTYTKTWGN